MRSPSLGRALACPASSEHSRKQPVDPGLPECGPSGTGCPGQPRPARLRDEWLEGAAIPPSLLHLPHLLPIPAGVVTCAGRGLDRNLSGACALKELWGGVFRGRGPPSRLCNLAVPVFPQVAAPSLSWDVRKEGATRVLYRGPTEPGGPQPWPSEVEEVLTSLVITCCSQSWASRMLWRGSYTPHHSTL